MGIKAFQEVGDRLEAIDARVPATLASLELSRSAERIIAAAPALLTATDGNRRDQVSAELQGEMKRLNAKLAELRRERSEDPALSKVEPTIASLSANLAALETLVAGSLVVRERGKSLMRDVFQTNEETSRLLSPWQMVIDAQVARLVGGLGRPGGGGGGEDTARELARLLEQGRPIQAAREQFSASADTLAEMSSTDNDRRLSVLAFQLERALRDLETGSAGLDAKLRTSFLGQVTKLRSFASGPQSVVQTRREDLRLRADGEKLLAENTRLSAQLAAAVDDVTNRAKREIDEATRDALSLQRLSTRLLISAVVLSLLTSALIVWLYVGRNIVGRLTLLSNGMLAIARGRLDAPVEANGSDEIAAMGRAVEVFRRNAIELEGLLEERKRSAEKLERTVEERTRELEQRSAVLRVTFDNMGHGVVMFDRELRMVAWNRHFKELLELPDDRVGLDTSFEQFIRYLAERGEYGLCDVEREVERHLTSVDRSYTDERTRPDDTVLDIRRNPIPGGGFVSIYADVTEQRRAHALVELARARLTDAIESLSDGFALWDKDDRLVIFNSRCEELLEAPELFVVGTRFEDLIRGFSRSGRYDQAQGRDPHSWIDERLSLHRNVPSACDLRLASGLWLHVREFRTQEGGTVTTWTDITTMKRREEDLETARDSAAQAYRELKATQASLIHAEKMASLGQLTAGIAHEIKNPLNFVNNFAGLSIELLDELKQGVAPELAALDESKRAEVDETIALLSANLDKIRSHGHRADGIVKSMLLHSRGGSGDRQTVDLNAVLDDALNLAYHGARAQDQSFNVTLERDLQGGMAPIDIVPQDMTRVFLNLFGNSLYAVAQRRRQDGEVFGPTLKVATRELHDTVEIAIRDNGIGIPPQHRERLFQPFFTTKPTGEGTGLGLSISYDIVTQQHGGTIAVDSEPGQFTEFTIRLPRRS